MATRLLSSRIVEVLWASQAISLVGSGASTIALSLAVYEWTGSVTALAAIVATKQAASIYFSPLVGALVDRLSPRRVIIGADLMLIVTSLLLAAVTLDEALPLALILGLTFAAGVLNGALSIALLASVRAARQEGDLTRVNAWISLAENGAIVAGPIVGAALYSAFGHTWVFVIDAGSFAVAALLVLALPEWGVLSGPGDGRRRLFAGAVAGLTWIWRRRDFRYLQISFAGLNALHGLALGVTAAYVIEASRGGLGEWNLALYNVSGSVGLIVGGLAVAALGGRIARRWLISTGTLLAASLGRALLALTLNPWMWAASSAARNVGIQLYNAPLTAIWQERIELHEQGAVLGARRLLGQGMVPVSVLGGGWLAESVFDQSGWLVQSVGNVLPRAEGAGGGMALMFLVLALGELMIALGLARSPHVAILSGPVVEETGSRATTMRE